MLILPAPLIPGILLKRYQRFLADVRLDDGRIVTAHCPNSGSMLGCAEPGWPVLISPSPNPGRKLKYTWELVHNGTCWIGINTHRTNHIAREAIENGHIGELSDYTGIRAEVAYGTASRIDLLLTQGQKLWYVEVKSVTLVHHGYYEFPDAITVRGAKHLEELMKMKKKGHRAVMLFIIQRSDGTTFRPAARIDPVYAQKLKNAYDRGVEILVYGTDINRNSIQVNKPVPFNL